MKTQIVGNIKTNTEKENVTEDNAQNGNDFSSMLIANGLPAFGTKEFVDMCSNFFGGNPSSNLKIEI